MPQPGEFPQSSLTQITLQQRGELPVLQIGNRHAEATIALQGAQLLEYTPRDRKPVIWLSDSADYQRGQSVRGGIPVCWPWFGALERNPDQVRAMTRGADLPAHGLVRARDWTLRHVREEGGFTEVTLGFSTDPLLQQWPFTADLELTIRVGPTLKMTLTTRNTSDQPIALSQALHTYFAVSDIDHVQLGGFDDTRYLDTLNAWREHPQQGAIAFAGETDRIYLDMPRQVTLHDSEWRRTLTISASGSASAVVWNPWTEKSKRLSQFAPDAWRRMVCIETANVLEDTIALAPGASHTLTLEISGE